MLSGRSQRRAPRNSGTSLRVGLLRHGETAGGNRFRGYTDDPLTAAGLAQMQAAVADSGNWDRVISSPLARCTMFADDFARQHSLPLSLDARLKEMHFGAWEGRTAAELMQTDAEALGQFWADPLHNTPPDGEPLTEFEARVLDAWNDIINEYAGQQLLVVTHGGVIRVLLCHLLQRPVHDLLSFEVKTASLRRIQLARHGKRTWAMVIEETRV